MGRAKRAEGLDAADQSFRVLNEGTARLVQLLADEMVPLSDATIAELTGTVERMRQALPGLADWRYEPASVDWVLGPPLENIGIRIRSAEDLQDIENVERLRRSFDFLPESSLALRKEAAVTVIDALLHELRSNFRPQPS